MGEVIELQFQNRASQTWALHEPGLRQMLQGEGHSEATINAILAELEPCHRALFQPLDHKFSLPSDIGLSDEQFAAVDGAVKDAVAAYGAKVEQRMFEALGLLIGVIEKRY